jgi:hypothetical protein
MRLWSIHPCYLDSKGLTACWREGLLARKVLQGGAKGYRNHPQLERFRGQSDPEGMVNAYLLGIYEEAEKRGYKFNRGKIGPGFSDQRIPVTDGQLRYEFNHLFKKLKKRSPEKYEQIAYVPNPKPHPIFRVISGGIEEWEKVPFEDFRLSQTGAG